MTTEQKIEQITQREAGIEKITQMMATFSDNPAVVTELAKALTQAHSDLDSLKNRQTE